MGTNNNCNQGGACIDTVNMVYTRQMIALLTSIVDKVLFDSEEKAILKAYIEAGGSISKMPESGMNQEMLKRRLKVAITVFTEQLKDFDSLIEENNENKRKLLIANAKLSDLAGSEHNSVSCEEANEEEMSEDDISISKIKMSKRLQSALKAKGIKNVSDLEKYSWNDFKKIENVGAKTLYELKDVFEEYGLVMRDAPVLVSANQVSVDDLPYTRWVKDALKDNDINTLADCANYREDQLYDILGRKNIVKRIKNRLARYGLSLKLYEFDITTKQIIEN